MHRLQKVIHRLHGIKRLNRDFDEHRNPVGHGAVPEAGQFKGFQLAAILGLVGDEARVSVHLIG